jgi:uncharacterized protein (TIGR03792 family)
MSSPYSYINNERRPVEVLVFQMDPQVVDEWIHLDHEIWTMKEALMPGLARIPFLSKEVWVDDSKPGQVTVVFVWDSMGEWNAVADPTFQQQLLDEFNSRFPHPYTLIAAPHEDSQMGIYRVSRFERTLPPSP